MNDLEKSTGFIVLHMPGGQSAPQTFDRIAFTPEARLARSHLEGEIE